MHAMAELRYTDALHALERCVALVPADEPWLLAASLLNAGAACGWAGDTSRADTLLRNAAGRYAELGDGDYYARALRLLATCRLLADDPTGASKLYREAYALSVPSGDLLGIAEALGRPRSGQCGRRRRTDGRHAGGRRSGGSDADRYPAAPI
jgi:tetratricopeptide (TPR) repeat protein